MFEKRQIPWNKGKKGLQVAWNKGISIKESHPQMGFKKGNKLSHNEKSRATQFKKDAHPSPQTEFRKGHTPWAKGKIPSAETRVRMSENVANRKRGFQHYLWIEDRTQLKKDNRRGDSAYGEWRKQTWTRDNFKCRIADENCSGKIEAHHILGWAEYPELRYQLNNGITLCHAHHPRRRAEEKRLIPTFQELVSMSVSSK